MKKTYIAPQIESIVINSVQLLSSSSFEVNSTVEVSEKSEVLSKGFGGGLWDDTIEDE